MEIKGCILPWVHIHGNMSGKYKVCCYNDLRTDPLLDLGDSTQSFMEVWHGDPYKEIRRKFLAGEIPRQCYEPCFKKEELGIVETPKNNANRFWGNYAPLQKTLTPPAPIYIDFRFGNICNFRCRTCGSRSSTSWFKEAKELFNEHTEVKENWDTETFWKGLELIYPNLKVVYFAGGEPLVLEQHYRVLEYLISKNKTDINLQYNTNLSNLHFKDYDLVSLWKKFKKVDLWTSCDGYNQVCEYTRKELVWEEFDRNVDIVKNYITSISSVVSIFTIYSMPDLILWGKKKNISIFGTTLISPKQYSLQILPDVEKEKIIEYYKTFIKENKKILNMGELRHIADWLRYIKGSLPVEEKSQLEKLFKKHVSIIDRSRNENFTSVVPQLADWYDSIKI